MPRYQDSSSVKGNGPQLSWQVSYRLGRPLIYVRGEFDHDTAGILREAINEELTEGTDILLLDFTDLTYMDSGGLSLMFDSVQRFKEPGWLGVVGANAGISRLMEITGLVDHPRFKLLPDLRAASDALARHKDSPTSNQ
jgi:anti-sigma B factor antagonist